MSIHHLVYSTHLYLKKSNVFVDISPQLHEVYSRRTTVAVFKLLAWLLNCCVVTDCLFWTLHTKHIKQKNNKKNLFLKYLCLILSVDMFENHVQIGCTHDLAGSENTFWSLFLRNWSRSVELWSCFSQKWLDIKCNDKDFQTFKIEITEGEWTAYPKHSD